ncbi:ATP-binding protein, partial [Streptomyces huiliensis]|uniref:ATP-binding protein n=1 Tax=Streptomyces huiliensis TaxID=2876027 RepID=UPI001CC190B5
MGTERVSRQELVRRRRDNGFQGRDRELAVFRDNLGRDPLDDAFHFLFHVHGLAGVGKSSLIRQWEALARRHGLATAMVGDEVHSAVEAMEAVSAELGRQGHPLKKFDKRVAEWRRQRQEAEATRAEPGAEGAEGDPVLTSPSSTLIAQAGPAGLGLVPGLGPVAGALDPHQLAAATDRARTSLGTLLHGARDGHPAPDPTTALTRAFLEDLDQVARGRPGVVLLFDTYERTGPVLDTWVRDMLFTETCGTMPANVQVVLAGQDRLRAGTWDDWLDQVTRIPLDVFDEDEARALLASRGIRDDRVVEVLLRLSGRLPVLLDTLAQARPTDPDAVGDPSGTAVDRFLKWIDTPAHRAAALACALPQRLDEDVYQAVVAEDAAGGYPW